MWWQFISIAGLLLFITITTPSYAQVPAKPHSHILAPDEGDHLGSHYIKADPQTGSMRLGAGLQHLSGRQVIPMHRHDNEDEILFIHAGSGVGAVGDERKIISAGTTLYIPQGTWHGIESHSDEMEVLWVSSPPRFAENLREISAEALHDGRVTTGELDEIGRRHGLFYNRQYFLLGFAVIAALLALGAVIIAVLNHVHPFRATGMYALGSSLAVILTLFALGGSFVPPIVSAIGTLGVALAIFIGAAGGIAFRSLTSRLTHRSG